LEIGSTFITIDGELEAPYLRFFDPGELTNNGSISGSSVITTKNYTYNHGVFQGTDSVVVGWYRRLENHGTMDSHVLYNLGIYNNYGGTSATSMYNWFGLYNAGVMTTVGTLETGVFFDNNGDIETDSLVMRRGGSCYGRIRCHSALVVGYPPEIGEFQIVSPGLALTQDLLVRPDNIVVGSGSICGSGNMVNQGLLHGFLNICDATPSMNVPPYLDESTGTIGAYLNFCEDPNCEALAVTERSEPLRFEISPNPVTDRFTITLNDHATGALSIELHDMLGRSVRTEWTTSLTSLTFERQSEKPGLHMIVVRDEQGVVLATRSILFAP
jgi:hypothetical protein